MLIEAVVAGTAIVVSAIGVAPFAATVRTT